MANAKIATLTTSVRYILICALRDKLFTGLIFGIVLCTLISAMMGSTAFLEEKEMTLSYAGASARMVLTIGLIVFCCFHVRTALDTREVEVMISRPVSRPTLVFAYWLGFVFISTVHVACATIVLSILKPITWAGFWGWSVSLLLETWFVVAMALFSALVLKSAVSAVMACFGFYAISRMMAFFVMSADSGAGGSEFYMVIARYILKAISTIMPRLDFFAKTEWLVYGMNSAVEWQLFMIQTLFFIPLLLAAGIIDFIRKQF